LELLQEFGAPLPIKRVTNTPNPVTGEVVATEAAGNLTAVILPAKVSNLNAVAGQLDNHVSEALTKGKVRFILAAAKGAPFAPDSDDVLTFENASWRVLGSTPLAPAGTAVLFKIGAIRV
jgi:hypothetical protein